MSRSRKTTLCPRALNARTSARNVVACPFPHDDVIDNPRITMSSGFVISLRGVLDAFEEICLVQTRVEQLLKLFGAMLVSVLGQDALPRGVADLAGARLAQRPQVANHVVATARDE